MTSVLILPLVYGDEPLGALFMASRSREFDDQDWIAFAQGVANQITAAVALTRSVEATAASEARARRSEQEARQSEAKALESRAYLRALLDAAPDAILYVDRNGLIRFINRLLPGWTEEQVIGASWLSFASSEHHDRLRSALESVLATGNPTSYEVTGPGPNGTTVWYSSHLGPARGNGDIVGAVIIARDITEQKLAEAQLITADRMAAV